MKSLFRRVIPAWILLLMLLFSCVLLSLPIAALEESPEREEEEESEDASKVVPSGFLCDFFLSEDGVFHYPTNGTFSLPLGANGKDISYSAPVTPVHYDTPNNALRLVLTNYSSSDHFFVKYTYVLNGQIYTETERVEVGAYSGRGTYLIRSPYVDNIINIIINMPNGDGNSIILYAMEAVRIWAAEQEETFGAIQSCTYQASSKTVTVKGSVFHDVMIAANGGTLQLFRLDHQVSVEDLLNDTAAVPLAQSAISIGFQLRAPAGDLNARYARYAVFILKPDGTRLLLCPPQYAVTEESAQESGDDRESFKGVDTTLVSGAIDSNVGSAVVDVYLNRLCNDRDSGYLYTVDDEYFYFDRAYLSDLDHTVRSLSGASCRVYLRFLVENDGKTIPCAVTPKVGSSARYLALSAENARSKRHLYACTSFLLSRYRNTDAGEVSGVIVGTRVDESTQYHSAGLLTLPAYTELYGEALSVIAMTATDIDPALQVIVPVSDGWNTSVIGEDYRRGRFTAELFLESLAAYLSHYGANAFTVMIESTHNPYALSNSYFEPINTDGEVLTEDMLPKLVAATQDSTYLSSENIVLLDHYLARYSAAYDSLKNRYFYHWTPNENTSGNALSASYVYHYYRLATDSRAAAFFVSFREKEEAGNLTEFSKIKYLVKYIDTAAGTHRTAFALDVFEAESWQNLITGFSRERIERTSLTEGAFAEPSTETIIGSYPLFDFTSANSPLGWYAGNRCESLSVRSSARYGKTLDAVMLADMSPLAEYADIAYRFAIPLSLEYSPYLTLTLSVDCEADKDAVFEVKLVVGSEEGYMEAKQVIRNGETVTVSLNAGHLSDTSEVEYMRLSAKTVMGNDDRFTLHVHSISLDSREYDSDALKTLIDESQSKLSIDSIGMQERSREEMMLVLAVSVAVVLFTLVGASILMHYQKNNPESE